MTRGRTNLSVVPNMKTSNHLGQLRLITLPSGITSSHVDGRHPHAAFDSSTKLSLALFDLDETYLWLHLLPPANMFRFLLIHWNVMGPRCPSHMH